MRGYCAIGIYRSKKPPNVGTLWRSAQQIQDAGCGLLFTIGARFPVEARRNAFRACAEARQNSDTMRATRHIPWVDFASVEEMRLQIPAAVLVGVELDARATSLATFAHPQRAIYLLGSEDGGIPMRDRTLCDHLIQIPAGNLNVAVAGSLVLYDRLLKIHATPE